MASRTEARLASTAAARRVTVPRFSICNPFAAPSQSLNSSVRNSRSQWRTNEASGTFDMGDMETEVGHEVKRETWRRDA